jgi:hypothetical protein
MALQYSSVEEFVKAHEGQHSISKILLANNGISAVKAMRSIRRWAYDTFGDERKVKFVAMATPEDLRANCEYIRMADEFVEVGDIIYRFGMVFRVVSLGDLGCYGMYDGMSFMHTNEIPCTDVRRTGMRVHLHDRCVCRGRNMLCSKMVSCLFSCQDLYSSAFVM